MLITLVLAEFSAVLCKVTYFIVALNERYKLALILVINLVINLALNIWV
jgi:hypothetical protein